MWLLLVLLGWVLGGGDDLEGVVRGEEDGPVDHILWYMSGWCFSSHSWHFFTVPPYSQYYLVRVC